MRGALFALALASSALLPATAAAWSDLDFGCEHPKWAGNTTSWHFMSQYMSDDLSAAQVQQIVTDSFAEWGNPGCSSITATQTATSSAAVPDPDGSIVFFEESVGWPADANILAYATPTPGAGCTISTSAIVFNAVTYTWTAGGGGNDLQSVMTHEVGHWLGLDHSSHPGATMAACYSGGTGDQVLSCDDTEGICALYPSGANTCGDPGGDDYCACGQKCEEGVCVADPEGTPGPGEQAASADGCDGEGDGSEPTEGDGTPGGDGSPTDTDSDGIPDATEGGGDTDGDGTPDFLDEDSDGDGIPDSTEAGPVPGSPPDTDGDGTPDFLDEDSDDDGIPDDTEAGDGGSPDDTDGDGTPDFLDEDSDDDSIPDSEEVGDDPEDPVDSDDDGEPDFLDDDSDGDGIPDEEEAGDDPDDPVDTDGDGDPDFVDTDSDGDGIPDADEVGDDPEDPVDTDGDGDPDFVDTDSDGDGVPDSSEGDGDSDGDGTPDFQDPDDDGGTSPNGFGNDFPDWAQTGTPQHNMGGLGCGCDSTGSSGAGPGALGLLLVVGLGRRRYSTASTS